MNIRDAHNLFIRECTDGTLQRRAAATISGYENTFEQFLRWLPVKAVSELSEGLFRQFFRHGEEERQWKPATTITHRKNLNGFIKWCVKRGLLEKNLLDEIPIPPLLRRVPEYYTKEEIDKMMYAVDICANSDFERKRNKAIMGVLLMVGLRKGELLALKMSDVDFESRTIRVRAETSKSRSPRVVPISFALLEVLKGYVKSREESGIEVYSFWVSSTTGEGFTVHGLKHLFSRLGKKTGFTVRAHKCRHTYATWLYDGSLDIVSVQKTLGHKDITTTMVYTHINQKQVASAMEKSSINGLF